MISSGVEGILLAAPRTVNIQEVYPFLNQLHKACVNQDTKKIMSIIKKLVPEYCGTDSEIYKLNKT